MALAGPVPSLVRLSTPYTVYCFSMTDTTDTTGTTGTTATGCLAHVLPPTSKRRASRVVRPRPSSRRSAGQMTGQAWMHCACCS